MASKRFYFSSLTLEAPVPFSPPPVAVSRPCLSLPVLLPDLLYKSFIKCHKLRFFGGCPYSREKKETRTKKSPGTPPPPPPICFPGLCLGCFQRGSGGRWGKGLALFTWGCIENRGSVESWNAANPPRVLGGGAGIAF